MSNSIAARSTQAGWETDGRSQRCAGALRAHQQPPRQRRQLIVLRDAEEQDALSQTLPNQNRDKIRRERAHQDAYSRRRPHFTISYRILAELMEQFFEHTRPARAVPIAASFLELARPKS